MSWHKAAAVLVLAIAPTLATAAYAKDPQRHHRAGPRVSAEVRHHYGHHARRHGAARMAATAGSAESASFGTGESSFGLVALAQQFRGTNPIGWAHAWCGAFANMILQRAGHSGSGSATARSFARYGRPAPGPAPGVIAVWPHHVGFVIGSAGPGKIRVVSGNHGHRVAEGIYSTRSVIASLSRVTPSARPRSTANGGGGRARPAEGRYHTLPPAVSHATLPSLVLDGHASGVARPSGIGQKMGGRHAR